LSCAVIKARAVGRSMAFTIDESTPHPPLGPI
jgi:hypothetical protein